MTERSGQRRDIRDRRPTAVGSLLLAAGCLLLSGCLSLSESLARQEREVHDGAVERAYEQAAGAAEADNADTAFWQQEAGTLALWLGRAPQALGHLAAAEEWINDLARRRYGASALDTASALALNDCALPYAPQGPELAFLNLYKALAYGSLANREAMRVECNRVRQRQVAWFGICAGDLPDRTGETRDLSVAERRAVAQISTQAAAQTPKLASGVATAVSTEAPAAQAHFAALQGFGNAYAAHLAGVTRWCAGDAPRNDLALAAALAPRTRLLAEDAATEARGVRPENRVWIYVEDGLAPKRVGRPYSIPYPSIAGHARGFGTISFDVPKLVTRAAAHHAYAVNGQQLEVLMEVDPLMQASFDRAWPGILARQVARTLLRVAMQEGGQAVLRHTSGTDAAALLWSLGMIVYDIGTNAADLRCPDLLPKRVWVGSMVRPADGRVSVSPTGGRPFNIQLRGSGNAIVWVRIPSPGATPHILVINL